MALSLERARNHIDEWSERLRSLPRCAGWPRHLFHAAHVETAVSILKSAHLSCRRRLASIAHDVANPGALHNNPRIHDFARLYFRPRNLFHLKTEGIKCLGDPYRQAHHMSIPILLAFDALSVLTVEGVCFSQGMLSKIRKTGHDERFFDRIPFTDVYHDSAPDPDAMAAIQDRRMAEVIVPQALPLDPHLRRVYCRTPLEKRTLLHLLGTGTENDRFRGITEVEPSLFFRQGLYLTAADFTADALHLAWHQPRFSPPSGRYSLRLTHHGEESPDVYEIQVPSGSSDVLVQGLPSGHSGTWEIHIEEVLAFHAGIPTGTAFLS